MGDELIDSFGGDEEDSLPGTAVNFRMIPGIALETERGHHGFGNGALGDPTARDVDL